MSRRSPLQVVFDCGDPARLADFYAGALGYKVQDPPAGFSSWEEWLKENGVPEEDWNLASAVVDPSGVGPRIYFQKMETPKLGKNRLHIDINASAGTQVSLAERKAQVDADVSRILGLGGVKDHVLEEGMEYCVVMLDPEGNEFCVQ